MTSMEATRALLRGRRSRKKKRKPTRKKAPPKRMTQRDWAVSKRLHTLGKVQASSEAFIETRAPRQGEDPLRGFSGANSPGPRAAPQPTKTPIWKDANRLVSPLLAVHFLTWGAIRCLSLA
ncbi:hypothetical protein SAMN05216337_104260 [Bradyrhizobium brasilense]|uniref:Uncharacterized protein n=1 Tax=Bradyrhizobium brasilense TaxID=1419277 RepID=A0A1G7HNH2_9BRAD|nr:hypothetical protein SAMN05216337_104260 [Bradyrhizobium brasilense]